MGLPVGPVEVAATQERRMYVTRADIERYGTDGHVPVMYLHYSRWSSGEPALRSLRTAELLRDSEKGRERLEQHRRLKRQGESAREDSRRKEAKSGGLAERTARHGWFAGGAAEPRSQDDSTEADERKRKLESQEPVGGDIGGATVDEQHTCFRACFLAKAFLSLVSLLASRGTCVKEEVP